MADKTTFTPQFIADLTKAMLEGTNDYEIAALHAVQGAMLQRIHNRRQARDESSLGKYKSASHKAKREEKGRQVDEKDLEFYGDLRRSVKVGKSSGKNVLGFDNSLSRLIAEGQEGQTQKVIYALSEREEQEMVGTYARLLNQRIKSFNNNHRT